MASLFACLILLGLVAVAWAGVEALFSSKRQNAPAIRPDWEPPKADPLPYVKGKYFFSAAERSFFEVLTRLLPRHTVFAKVRLADVVRVPKGISEWRAHHNRIDRKHLDFVICDTDLVPVLAVELDDSSHDLPRRQEQDDFVDRALAAAGFPIVHVRARRGYQPAELRALLAPHLGVAAHPPGGIPAGNNGYMQPAGWRPAVESGEKLRTHPRKWRRALPVILLVLVPEILENRGRGGRTSVTPEAGTHGSRAKNDPGSATPAQLAAWPNEKGILFDRHGSGILRVFPLQVEDAAR